jgi:hypothetical protein
MQGLEWNNALAVAAIFGSLIMAAGADAAPCHVVAGDQQGTTGGAPPFASIARKPGFDTGQLALFLLDPHPKMPNMSLTRIEAR